MAESSSPILRMKPPRYAGSLLSVYFRQLRDYFDLEGITSDSARLAVFRMGLQSPDYQRFCLQTSLPSTFDGAEDKLLALFEPEMSAQACCDAFLTAYQLPRESVALFAERVISSCAKAYPTVARMDRDALVISQLRRGLRNRRLKEVARLSDRRPPSCW